MPPRKNKPGKHKTTYKYGCLVSGGADPLAIELACIRHGGRWQVGGIWAGKGMAFHVKEAMKLLWPEMYWHRWTHMLLDAWLEGPGRFGVFGPSSSQKSFTFSRAGLVLFYANPHKTTGMISSTTLEALKRRIWDYVVSSDKEARSRYEWLPGSLIESKLMLLADESATEGRSFKNGIIGVAAKKGGQWKGLEEYVGLKNDVVFVIADELHFMSAGVLDSIANLSSNEDMYFVGMGNLPDIHNPLGWLVEPKIGWDALPDTDKSRVYPTRWKNGRAVQLIGMDSPNLDFPEGREPYKGLIGRRYIEECAENYGRESDKFNMFASGKIPRASMSRTVFSKAMCLKFNAKEQVKWGHHQVIRGYGLDAAYSGVGGDRTVGFPFIIGKDVTGRWKFWLGPMKTYPGSDSPRVSHSEAIATECKRECEAHDIPPAHVFYDGTGRSELTSAFARLWSPQVVPLEFGGPATERPSFTGEKHLVGETKDDKNAGEIKTCREQFDRFVTELWFAVRYCIQNDQMRGMPEEAIEEGSQRKWELVRGAKYCIETKEEMKERGLRSLDICFTHGTWITTPFGEEQIQNLKEGDSVVTPMGFATIMARRERKADNVIVASFSDGSLLSGTADHKIFTWNRGWTRMDAIVLTDELEHANNLHLWDIRNALFTKAEHTSFKHLVDTIRMATGRVVWTDFYIGASGLMRVAQFLKAIVSITKTVTGRTIGSAIWSLCGSLTTLQSTVKSACGIQATSVASKRISTRPAFRRLGGTDLPTEESGTLKLPKTLGLSERQKPLPATFAGSSMKGFSRIASKSISALDLALRNHATEKSSWMASVKFVARALRLTNTSHRNTAPTIVAQSPLQGLSTVYTLTLDRHNVYYANGILVANCDAIVCACEGARRLGFPLGKTPETKAQSFRWLESMREHEWDKIKKDELESV